MEVLSRLGCVFNVNPEHCLTNVLSVCLSGLDARGVLFELGGLICASDDAARPSRGTPLTVLTSRGLSPIEVNAVVSAPNPRRT